MQRLGRYEIIDEIGRGGMGVVYRARDQRFNREVAIKVLPRAISSREELAERFNREAQAIARLEHNAIVPVYDYGDENGALYLVMRLMGGGSLADRIVKGPMNIEEAAPIISRVAEALDAAHDRGLIHRDVKPGNILFDAYGAAFLSDFGIVKLDEAATMLTGTGAVGTPAYMAPEMADGVVSPAGDIYSLGVTLYQMLTGQLPFRGTTPIAMIMAHISEPVPDLRAARPDLPEAVQAIVEKGLAKKPENRFPNAQRMAKALAAVADGPASTVKRPPNRAEIEARLKATAPMPQTRGPQPTSSPPPPPEPIRQTGRVRRRAPLLLIGGLVGILVLILSGLFVAALLGLIPFPAAVVEPTATVTPTSAAQQGAGEVTATATPSPTPTPVEPTPTVPGALTPEEEVAEAVRRYDEEFRYVLSTLDTSRIGTAARGNALEARLSAVATLREAGDCVWRYEHRGLEVQAVTFFTDSDAEVIAEVDRDGTVFCDDGERPEFAFTGPFEVRYQLEQIGGVWYVVDSENLIDD